MSDADYHFDTGNYCTVTTRIKDDHGNFDTVVQAVPPQTRARLVSQAERDALKRKYDQPENGIPMHVPTTGQQCGGTHYLEMPIQPWEVIDRNKMGFHEGNALKYLMRWRAKGGVEDLRKAIHYIEHQIELEEKSC